MSNSVKEEKRKKIISQRIKSKKTNDLHDKKFYDELDILNSKTKITGEKLKRINEENFQIVKDNRLIQKGSFDFTEMELKCLNYTISKIKPGSKLSENEWIEYKFKDLIKILNIKNSSKSVQLIKESLKNLRTKGKWVRIEDKEVDLSFFLKCEIENLNGENIVRVRFMQEILNYLVNLHKNFTTQYLIYSMRLKGKYAIRLYELCKSFQSNYIKELGIFGFNFYIDKMRKLWCLSDSYKNSDIKRILEKSISEVNEKTDIELSIYNIHKIANLTDYYVIKVEPNHNYHKIYKEIVSERKV